MACQNFDAKAWNLNWSDIGAVQKLYNIPVLHFNKVIHTTEMGHVSSHGMAG